MSETKRRRSLLTVFAVAWALLLPLPFAAAQPVADLPEGVLAVVELRDPWGAWRALAGTVAAVSGPEAEALLEAEWARLFGPHTPRAAQPAYALWLAGEDQAAPRWALLRHRPASDGGEAGWRFAPDEGEAPQELADWLRKGGLPAGPGQIGMAFDLRRILATHEAEAAAHLEAMKARMAEAAREHAPGDENRIATAARMQLDLAYWAFRQADRVVADLLVSQEDAFVSASLVPSEGSLLAAILGAQPQGGLDLAEQLPGDAIAVAAHALSLPEMLAGLMAVMGFGQPRTGGGQPAGAAAFALLPSSTPEASFEAFALASGARAAAWRERWVALAQGSGWLRLDPVPAEGADELDAEAARPVLNASAMPPGLARLFARLFGEEPLAAMAAGDGWAALALSHEPFARFRAMAPGLQSPAPALRNALARFPTDSHAMLYVSPQGIAKWLALGGRHVPTPEEGDGGLALALRIQPVEAGEGTNKPPEGRLRPQGWAEGFALLPIGTVRRAMLGAAQAGEGGAE